MAAEFKSGPEDRSLAAGLHPVGWHGDGLLSTVGPNPAARDWGPQFWRGMAQEFKSGPEDRTGLHPLGGHGNGLLLTAGPNPAPRDLYNPAARDLYNPAPRDLYNPAPRDLYNPAASSLSSKLAAHPVSAFQLDLDDALPEVPRFEPAQKAAAEARNASFFAKVTRAGMLARGKKRSVGGWPY